MIKRYYGNELYHHGVQGQKWGIRNYQNKDGSLTAEGKARRAAQQQKAKAKAAKQKARKEKRAARIDKLKSLVSNAKARHEAKVKEKETREKNKVVRTEDMSKYTTEELNAMTKRLAAENNYIQARNRNYELNPVKVSAGKRLFDALKKETANAISEYAKSAYKDWVKKQLGNMVSAAMNNSKEQSSDNQQKQQNNKPKQQNDKPKQQNDKPSENNSSMLSGTLNFNVPNDIFNKKKK